MKRIAIILDKDGKPTEIVVDEPDLREPPPPPPIGTRVRPLPLIPGRRHTPPIAEA